MFRNIVLPIIMSLQVTTAFAGETCDILQDVETISYNVYSNDPSSKLSDFWADEITGLDLVELDKIQKTDILSEQPAFICDTSNNNHNLKVQSIVDRDSSANPSHLVCDADDNLNDISNHDFSLLLQRQNSHESIVNFSMSFAALGYTSNDYVGYLNQSLLVYASGNNWDNGEPFLNHINILLRGYDADPPVIVGSFSPEGLASRYSQEGEKVSILAPVGDTQYTFCRSGVCDSFGGTSAAAPQITYIFKLIRGLIPNISKANLIKLMKVTATSTLHSKYESPKYNGAGLINIYKMWRVAQRLKSYCSDNEYIPVCIDSKLEDNEILNFDSNANAIAQGISQNFPSCPSMSFDELSCDEKKSKFHQLRKGFLLDSKNQNLKKALQCAYKNIGYLGNSIMLANLVPENNAVQFSDLSNNPKALRFLPEASQEVTLTRYFLYRESSVIAYLTQLSLMGAQGINLLLTHGNQKTSPTLRPRFGYYYYQQEERALGENIAKDLAKIGSVLNEELIGKIESHPDIVKQYSAFFDGFASFPDENIKWIIGRILVQSEDSFSRSKGYQLILESLKISFSEEKYNLFIQGLEDSSGLTRERVQTGIEELE